MGRPRAALSPTTHGIRQEGDTGSPGATIARSGCASARRRGFFRVMADAKPHEVDVTRLLARAGEGDENALDRAFGHVYYELRALAERQRHGWTGDHTLNATALVHEVYLKLVGRSPLHLRDRGHFFALAARAMRQILCNYARDRKAEKRGGEQEPVPLDGLSEMVPAAAGDGLERLIALDQALARLAEFHPRAGRVVECRFFGGMTVAETAAALDVSDRTVKRDWDFAQTWLFAALEPRP